MAMPVHHVEVKDKRYLVTDQNQLVDVKSWDHDIRDWLAEKFDHDRDSRFSLRGGHERVACAVCHLPLPEAEGRSLRFKPLPVDCRACHTNNPPAKEENR